MATRERIPCKQDPKRWKGKDRNRRRISPWVNHDVSSGWFSFEASRCSTSHFFFYLIFDLECPPFFPFEPGEEKEDDERIERKERYDLKGCLIRWNQGRRVPRPKGCVSEGGKRSGTSASAPIAKQKRERVEDVLFRSIESGFFDRLFFTLLASRLQDPRSASIRNDRSDEVERGWKIQAQGVRIVRNDRIESGSHIPFIHHLRFFRT